MTEKSIKEDKLVILLPRWYCNDAPNGIFCGYESATEIDACPKCGSKNIVHE